MKIIDAHCHVFPPEIIAERERIASREKWFGELYRNPRNRLATADDLVSSMQRARIDQAVIFGFAFNDPGLCHLCNAYVFDAVRRYPGKLFPFVVVQPKQTDSALRELGDGIGNGALGLGELLPDGQGFTLDEWRTLDPLMEAARSAGLPLMLHVNEQLGHAYPGKGSFGVSAGYVLGARYTENVLILSHWGGGLFFYELMPEVQRALRNIYYDTAASVYLYDDRIFNYALSWMPDKILWASDFPLLSQKSLLKRIDAIGLAPEQLECMYWQNISNLLKLAPVGEHA